MPEDKNIQQKSNEQVPFNSIPGMVTEPKAKKPAPVTAKPVTAKAATTKATTTKAVKQEPKSAIPAPQDMTKIQFWESPTQQITKMIEEEKVKEPKDLTWLSSSFSQYKALDTKYQGYSPQGRMKIESYSDAFKVKNNEIKRHQKVIDGIVTKTTSDLNIDDLTKLDSNGNRYLDKERLRRIVTRKVENLGGNEIVADYVFSKAAVAAENRFNLNNQKKVFETKLKTANIKKPKDAAIVEQEFKDIQLSARGEMKVAQESVKSQLIKESETVNAKYVPQINSVLMQAPYPMAKAVEDAKVELSYENADYLGEREYFEGMQPRVSDAEVTERANALFQAKNQDYLTTQYLPVVGQMQAEIKALSGKYNNILKRKGSEIQSSYEKKFSEMKALYEKDASDYNAAIDKLWNEAGEDLKNQYESNMKAVYEALGAGANFTRNFMKSAGGMLSGIGSYLRMNGIDGSFVDFLASAGQDAQMYNNTYTPSVKDAYLSPKYWAGAMGEMMGSSAVIAGATIATRNPFIGGLLSNIVEGSSMAGSVYNQQILEGKDPVQASSAASEVARMNLATMPLNALQAKLFMPFTKGAGFTGAFKKVTAGALGGTLEEMGQATFEEGKGFQPQKFYAPETLEMGVRVFGAQMFMGAPGGAMSGLVQNLTANKNNPSALAQTAARMIRENGPSRVAAVGEALNITGEIDDEQTAQMKILSEAILDIENEANSIGLEGDKKDAFVGITYDIRELEKKKETVKSESAKAVIDNQISEKKKQLSNIINDKTELAAVVIAGTKVVVPVEEAAKIVGTDQFAEAAADGDVQIETTNADLTAKVEEVKQQKTRQRNIISDTGEIVGQVPAEVTPVTEAAPAVQAEAPAQEATPITQIKTQEDATQISERAQQEIPQPSDIVQREGTQEGQPQVGQAEGAVGQTAQPAADTRNRNLSSQAQEVAPPVVEAAPAAPMAEAAPVTEAAPIDELINLDVKEPGNLEKIYSWLDNADKALGKQIKPGKLFDIGSAAGAGAIATAQAIVKALKAAVSATVSLKEAISKVAKDFNISDNEVLNAIKTATDEQAKIDKASAKVSSIEKQIKDFARGAKDAISTWRKASEALGNDIKAMVKDGTITTKQAANIIKKFGKINILSPKAVSKFVDYMTKVFSDAEYQNKLDGARSLKKDIAKLAKGKDRDARLKDIGKRFLKVEPTEVDDIDEYNRIGEQLKESLRGTKRTKTGIELASIINIDDVGGYIQKAIDAQDIKMREDTAKEFQELFGVDPAEFSYDDMLELMETKGEVPKKNEAIIRSAINKAFGIYSTVIKKTIANGVDPFTEAPVEISESKKELLQRFMNMDLGRLDIKLAMQAVDALNNFVTNKSIAKMNAVVSQYEGGLGAKQVNDKNIKSFPLKKLFSPNLGRAFGEYTTNLGALFERMFKGVTRGGFVETKSGVSRIKRGKATAETRANGMAKDYVTDFYKKGKYGVMFKNVNGEEFNTLKNNVERGVIAFLSRNIIGTKAQREAEFNRRKRHFLQSIDALMGGTEKEKKLGEIYKEIADKLGISEATDALSIFSKADENNQKGVSFWREKWDSVFDELAEVSEGIYNKILGKDTDFIPDRYKRLTGQPKQDELSITESAFHYNSEGDIYKKETGVLMKAERPDDLPPGTYIDLSFDNNNASSMYDALVDIHTAAAIRQWEGFSKSAEFNKIINAEDRDMFRNRISLYIKAIRNKAPYVNDELEKGLRRINVLTSVGVGQALAGLATPFKQTLGVIPNTLINAGRIDLKALSDKNKNDFINRSGYSIANRGVESQAQLDSLNRIIEIAATSTPEKALKIIEKANNFYLKTLLVNRDAWVARVSWLAYYEQSLENQGIDPSGIDWATHQINEEAGDYAQRMVDRQQNISDPAEAGKMFVGSESSIQKLVVRMAMPFASFRMNQSTRLANDLSVLGYWSTSTKEDRIIAARSLAGLAAEMVTFRLVSIGAALAVGYASYAVMGDEPDEEELQKWKDNIYRGQVTNTVNDILSPLPVTDKIVQEGVFAVTDDIQTIAGISDEEKVNIFQPQATDYLEGLGLFGITAQRGKQMIDITSLAILDNGFKDKFGNERFLLEKDKEVLSVLLAPALLSSIGALPSEFNSIVRKSLNDAKKRALTEKQIKAGGKKEKGKKKGKGLGGGGLGSKGLGSGGLGGGGLR